MKRKRTFGCIYIIYILYIIYIIYIIHTYICIYKLSTFLTAKRAQCCTKKDTELVCTTHKHGYNRVVVSQLNIFARKAVCSHAFDLFSVVARARYHAHLDELEAVYIKLHRPA